MKCCLKVNDRRNSCVFICCLWNNFRWKSFYLFWTSIQTHNGCWKINAKAAQSHFWWLVRVTLVVDWRFLPQNVGPAVGTYKGLLWLCEWTLGGTPTLLPVCFPHSQLASLTPSLLPSLPACSPCSQLAPLTPSLLPSPLPPQRWWGPQNIV